MAREISEPIEYVYEDKIQNTCYQGDAYHGQWVAWESSMIETYLPRWLNEAECISAYHDGSTLWITSYHPTKCGYATVKIEYLT